MSKVYFNGNESVVELKPGNIYVLSGQFNKEVPVPLMGLISFDNRSEVFEYLDSRDLESQKELAKLYSQLRIFTEQGNKKMVMIMQNTINKKLGNKGKGNKKVSLYVKDNNHREFENGYIPTREDREEIVSPDMIAIFTNDSRLVDASKIGYRAILNVDEYTTLYQLT